MAVYQRIIDDDRLNDDDDRHTNPPGCYANISAGCMGAYFAPTLHRAGGLSLANVIVEELELHLSGLAFKDISAAYSDHNNYGKSVTLWSSSRAGQIETKIYLYRRKGRVRYGPCLLLYCEASIPLL